MIVYLIILGIILACLITMAVVVVKKFPKLSALDLEAMKQHKHSQVKVSIVEERLERNLKQVRSFLVKKIQPILNKLLNYVKKIYHKFLASYNKYKEQEKTAKPLKQQDKEAIRQKINRLITEAEEFINQDKTTEAEKKYIAAISLDKQNIDPYKKLAELYIIKKDYEHAQETLKFIQEISPNDEVVWRQLGNVCSVLDNTEESVTCYKKAVEIAPNNPKNLDLLLQMSIKAKDRYLAQSTLKKLEEVNPDNQKLQEYQEQIENL